MLKPEVIYLKSKQDKMLIATEKPKKFYPQDEHGYFGGSSPSRKDVYMNENLARKYREDQMKRKMEQNHVREKVIDFAQLDVKSDAGLRNKQRNEMNSGMSMKSIVTHQRGDSQSSISVQSLMSTTKEKVVKLQRRKRAENHQLDLPYWERD
jgi:hypothetical protein